MWFHSYFNIYLDANIYNSPKRKLNKFKNNVLYQNVFARLLSDAMHRYEFEGLPDTVSERVILQSLLWYNGVCFFEKNNGIFALPAMPSGQGFNIYGEVGDVWVYARNGQMNEQVKVYIPDSDKNSFLKALTVGRQTGKPHGVMVYENINRYPFVRDVMYFTEAITDTLRTIDVARRNIKSPFIITAEESLIPTIKRFFEERDDNNEYIISSGIFPVDKVNVMPITTSTDALKGATELCEWYENKFREICGFDNNTQVDKKGENLIEAEVSVNNEYTEKSVDKCLKYIQKGLDNVNEFFGLNIKVKPVCGQKDMDKTYDRGYNKEEEKEDGNDL